MQSPLISSKSNTAILVVTACVAFILAFYDILVAIVTQWVGDESAGYNHGFLVLLCTVYLLYLKRDQLRELTPDPQKLGFIPLTLLVILLLLAELTEIQALKMLIIPLLVFSSIYIILGKQYLKKMLVPIGIIVFALPIWKPLLPILQDITTWITDFNLSVLGRPAYVVGNYVHITGGVFLIEEACSGLRFLLIATILSLINSDMNFHTRKQTITLLALAIGLAFLANWLRVIIIVVLGDITDMQHSLVHDHVNFGWLVFLFVVLIPYLLIARLVPQPTQVPKSDSEHDTKTLLNSRYFFVTLLVILSVPALRYGLQAGSSASSQEIEIPLALDHWNGNGNVLGKSAWRPDYKNATDELFRSYSGSSGVEIDLHVFNYSEQKQGAELINVENNIADGAMWNVVPSTESRYLISDANQVKKVNAVEVVNNQNERKLVWYWYDIGGFVTSSQYAAKLLQIVAQLKGENYARLTAVSIVCGKSCGEKQHYLEDYVSAWQVD